MSTSIISREVILKVMEMCEGKRLRAYRELIASPLALNLGQATDATVVNN
jgi:hypothetical protein